MSQRKKISNFEIVSVKKESVINSKKQNFASGITLIALVVTIVVLLILAGITITFVLGDDGIINFARKATIQTEQASILEQLRINVLDKDMKDVIGEKTGSYVEYLKQSSFITEETIDNTKYYVVNVENIIGTSTTGKGNMNDGDVYYILNGDLYYKDQTATILGNIFKETEEDEDIVEDNAPKIKWLYEQRENGDYVIIGMDLTEFNYVGNDTRLLSANGDICYDLIMSYGPNLLIGSETLVVPASIDGHPIKGVNLDGENILPPIEEAEYPAGWGWREFNINNVKKIIFEEGIENIEKFPMGLQDGEIIIPSTCKRIGDEQEWLGGFHFLVDTSVRLPVSVSWIAQNVFASVDWSRQARVTMDFYEGMNPALVIPDNKWKAETILVNGVKQ